MINNLIDDIKTVLTEDLLTDHWKKIIRTKKCHPTTGHCYAASEALYHPILHFLQLVSRHKCQDQGHHQAFLCFLRI